MTDGEGNGKEAYSKSKSRGIQHIQIAWDRGCIGFYLTVLYTAVSTVLHDPRRLHVSGNAHTGWAIPLLRRLLSLRLDAITRSSSGFPEARQNFLMPFRFLLDKGIVWQPKVNR